MTSLTKIKINKTAIIVMPFLAFSIYSIGVDFRPTPIFEQFAPIIWMPIGLFMAYSVVRDPKSFTEKAKSFPLWRKLITYVAFSGILCFLAHAVVVFGIADIITAMIGTPFQESSIIAKKTSSRACAHRIDVDKFQTAAGGLCLDGFLGSLPDDYIVIWKASKKGDKVILIGKKSSLGCSTTKILSEK